MIDQLFLKLSMFYGNQFFAKWQGIDIKIVKNEWDAALHNFSTETIGKALNYVRDNNEFPPSLPEFIKICKEFKPRPEDLVEKLEHKFSPVSPEKAKENLKQLKAMLANSKMVLHDD